MSARLPIPREDAEQRAVIDPQAFTIDGKLMGLNEYTRQCRSNPRAGNAAKRHQEAIVYYAIRQARIQPVHGQVELRYTWYEPDQRRDLDNVAFAQKFVQDALVAAGIIAGDGQKHIAGFTHRFEVDKARPRVEVEIWEASRHEIQEKA